MRVNYKRLMTKDICVYDDVRFNLKEIFTFICFMPIIILLLWLILCFMIVVFS